MDAKELLDSDLTEIEMRLMRGWFIRPDQIRSLIRMARERNWLKQEASEKAKQENKED